MRDIEKLHGFGAMPAADLAEIVDLDVDEPLFELQVVELAELEELWGPWGDEDLMDDEPVIGLVAAWQSADDHPPPILAVRQDDGLLGLDGLHRCHAAWQAGRTTIPAWVADLRTNAT